MQSKNLTFHGPVPTVGFLVDWLEDSYQWTILHGALDAARDRGARLMCFAGGILGDTENGGASRNGVYNIVGPANVDALVILAGTIGNFVGTERLRAYCERWSPAPMCSVGLALEGMSSVCVDNDSGMRAVLTHLIRHHGMKHVAFVCGPAANGEAERRLAIYREILADNGLAFDPRLVAPGDFQPQGGREAVRIFFDERKLRVEDIDAIAAANDSMALGILEELDDRAIRVPERIALVGFDDVEEARFTTPPLTTVRQPLYKQGREAVGMVLDQLRDGVRVHKVELQTELVTRRSCRCFTKRTTAASGATTPTSRLGFEALLVGRRQLILADLSRAARGAFAAAGTGWEQRLLNAFTDQVRGDTPDGFVEAFDDVLRRLARSSVDVSTCYDVIATLRRQVLSCLSHEPLMRPVAEDLFHEVGELTGNVMERVQAWERISAQQQARFLGRAGSTLVTTFNLDDLAKAVGDSLPMLGIESCFVAVHEPRGSPEGERSSRLILAYDPGARLARRPDGATYNTAELVPRSFWPTGRDHGYVVAPLVYDTEELGLLILELGASDGFVYEALRQLFSAAIKGAQTIDQLNAEVVRRNTLSPRLDDRERRLSAIAKLQEDLAGTIEQCRALAGGKESAGARLDVIESELVRLHAEMGRLLAPSTIPPSGKPASERPAADDPTTPRLTR